jgi:heat shock protein HslJ
VAVSRIAPLLATALLAGCASLHANQGTFEGTEWQVVAINQRPTPRSDVYRLTFRDGRLGARFGCNHIGGRYRASGGTLVASDITSTLMGCPEPSATFERQASAVLQQPMRLGWQSDRRLTLSNAAGSIELELKR